MLKALAALVPPRGQHRLCGDSSASEPKEKLGWRYMWVGKVRLLDLYSSLRKLLSNWASPRLQLQTGGKRLG
jgi:hypothetical protein